MNIVPLYIYQAIFMHVDFVSCVEFPPLILHAFFSNGTNRCTK